MQRCIELAQNGNGRVAPNPMVGAVIVHKGEIIGEGYHEQYGASHAEVNAVQSVKKKSLLQDSTLYVNLEPCNHFGKTPPCTDLILENKIPKVVIGCMDNNPLVSGKGIEKLRQHGVEVVSGVMEAACKELNKTFFYFNAVKLPFVILKWAQSKDGFIGNSSIGNLPISNSYSHQLVHKWRAETMAILVGTNTAAIDNPALTVRNYAGKNPVRVVLDKNNRLPESLQLFDGAAPTLVFTNKAGTSKKNLSYIETKNPDFNIHHLLTELAERKITSLLVEGGSAVLQSFIDQNFWNEARVFYSDKILNEGIAAPNISGTKISSTQIKNDTLVMLKNQKLKKW